jgi:putative redox protein
VHLTFNVTGPVPQEAIERAIALSHEKYCSVSNTLRPDMDFTTSVIISA